MTEKNKTHKGILSWEGKKTFLLGENGEVYFENEKNMGRISRSLERLISLWSASSTKRL